MAEEGRAEREREHPEEKEENRVQGLEHKPRPAFSSTESHISALSTLTAHSQLPQDTRLCQPKSRLPTYLSLLLLSVLLQNDITKAVMKFTWGCRLAGRRRRRRRKAAGSFSHHMWGSLCEGFN